jgi:hypothetical protein
MPEVRIVGLANQAGGQARRPRHAPTSRRRKFVDADFAGGANDYSPKTAGF